MTIPRMICLLALAAVPALANLIDNPGFEIIPGPASGQGILPSSWLQLAPTPGADTYSNDGSYGVLPAALGNFTGLTAHDGIRWVAGGSGGLPIVPVPEVFGQMLSAPLIPGESYTLSAFLIAAQRPDISGAGTYRISLASDAAHLGSAVPLGMFDSVNSTTAWEFRSFSFTAPGSAGQLPLLVFTPYATGAISAYPGLDAVSLTGNSAPAPEPGTQLLAGLSLTLLWLGRRRTRRG